MTSRVSSVTFPRASYNLRQAMKWLKEHDLKPSKRVDKSATKLRYRILDPAQFDHFATKEVSGGIQLIIGFPEPEQQAQDPFPTSSQQPAPGPPKGGKPPKTPAARGGAVGTARPVGVALSVVVGGRHLFRRPHGGGEAVHPGRQRGYGHGTEGTDRHHRRLSRKRAVLVGGVARPQAAWP